MTQETAGESAYDLEVLEADTAVSLNFSLREGMRNRTYIQSSGLHRIMYSF